MSSLLTAGVASHSRSTESTTVAEKLREKFLKPHGNSSAHLTETLDEKFIQEGVHMTGRSTRPFDSVVVMAYLIKRCREIGVSSINATKMQKLVYCCYGVCLAKFGYRLCDESPEAWKFGPVFPRTLKVLQAEGLGYAASVSTQEIETSLPADISKMITVTLKKIWRICSKPIGHLVSIAGFSLDGKFL